eukprot:356869-Chlamydomonas_euryale.AAC.1
MSAPAWHMRVIPRGACVDALCHQRPDVTVRSQVYGARGTKGRPSQRARTRLGGGSPSRSTQAAPQHCMLCQRTATNGGTS